MAVRQEGIDLAYRRRPAGLDDPSASRVPDEGAVEDGLIVGLGSGSTAPRAVGILGQRVSDGLRIIGIPTSERTEREDHRLGIPLSTLSEHDHIDVTIDGADEVAVGSLNLLKGRGGALLREQIVASATEQLIIVTGCERRM